MNMVVAIAVAMVAFAAVAIVVAVVDIVDTLAVPVHSVQPRVVRGTVGSRSGASCPRYPRD